jgi:hypothetical protein
MAYQCPRCGGPVERGASTAAGVAGGLVGAMIFAAFGAFRCKTCGPIPRPEFPPDVQQKMLFGSVALIVTAVVVLIAALALIAYLSQLQRV